MSDFVALTRLLEEFKKIPVSARVSPTFMEISGYPHLENVCSNILSFFLTADECHGMGDLLLRALFLALDRNANDAHFESVNVEREARTDLANRIDLVIESDRYVIGIENKVFSSASNDLRHYGDHVRNRAAGTDKEVVLVLLTLLPIRDTGSISMDSFRAVTYDGWFQAIQELLGSCAPDCEQRYLIYLLDFISTLKRLARGPDMDKELLALLDGNEAAISGLIQGMKRVRAEFRKEVEELGILMHDRLGDVKGIRQWVCGGPEYPRPCLVHDLESLGSRQLAVDTVLSPCGWSVLVWTRRRGPEDLRKWVEQRDIRVEAVRPNGRLVHAEWPYGTGLGTVAESLSELLKRLA